jgi:serine/threonine protein kinase
MMLAPGDIVDRYRVIREIGRGGMAVVYLVEHTTLDTHHALKVLTQTSAAIRDRLILEGRVQAKLKHPNLVAVTDVLDVEGSPGLLMEYVDGPSLRQWLERQRPDVEVAKAMFRAIVAGVARAHQAGVIHRDMKPGNVLLDAQAGMVPKITDFGLAKALEANTPAMHQTRSGMAMGTPSYMAPEQIRDAKTVDGRADIFALGCVFYELICGEQAFPGQDTLEVMNRVTGGVYTPPTEVVADLPDPVVAAINGCLQPKRRLRIPDCETLMRILDGESWAPNPLHEDDPNSTYPSLDTGEVAAARALAVEARGNTASGRSGTSAVGAVGVTPRIAHRPMPPQASDGRETISLTDGSWTSFDPAATSAPQSSPEFASLQRRYRILGIGVLGLVLLSVVAVAGFAGMLGLEQYRTRTEVPSVSATRPSVAPSRPAASVPPTAKVPTVDSTGGLDEASAPAEPSGPEPTPPEPRVPDPPAAEPAPSDPAPAPEATPTGRVRFSGADAIQLTGANGTFGPGAIPPGTYRISAQFGARVVSAGRVVVTAGDDVLIRCDVDFEMCSR